MLGGGDSGWDGSTESMRQTDRNRPDWHFDRLYGAMVRLEPRAPPPPLASHLARLGNSPDLREGPSLSAKSTARFAIEPLDDGGTTRSD